MPTSAQGHECYHCKQWVAAGEAHDCWTTTEAALTRGLSEDLQDAYERFREAAVEFGEQRIYASHNSIMFARRACYCFVRPKKSYLEICVFLGRELKAPQVRTSMATSKTKFANLLRVTHRDEVEAPLTDWISEAFEFAGEPAAAKRPSTIAKGSGGTRAAGEAPAARKRAAKKR
jgi:hypothetical protein